MSWTDISVAAQAELLQKIPERWRIDQKQYSGHSDVSRVPVTSGILSKRQIEITELTVSELHQRIRTRALRATEILEAFAARAAIAHQLANCLTDWFYEEGLHRARELDEILENGGDPIGPLHGIPVALKDTYGLKGHVTTRGYIVGKGVVYDHTSDIIETLRAAGAVFYCRTTMPQTGFILETVSNLWGRTLNPFNNRLGAGGSSGGDAALVAMKGAPIALPSDTGGSIRAPAAFCGLYAIRPTSLRIPKGKWAGTMTGQISIRDSAGPICHSIDDVRLFTEVIGSHQPQHRYDTNAVPIPWRKVSLPEGKLSVGIMKWDGVVMPQPPVLRAIEHTKQVLVSAGFEVVEFSPPVDCWELAKCYYGLIFQDGGADTLTKVAVSGEPLMPAFADLLKIYNARSLAASEVLKLNLQTRAYKTIFAEAWDKTKDITCTGRPIDALICPPAPSTGIPHDFNAWWGYTSMWNLLDYPSTVIPIANFRISPELDPREAYYKPLDTNPYDQQNYAMYDPNIFVNQPSTIQIVGRPFDDEELIEVSALVDKLLQESGGASHKSATEQIASKL
ncbi:amidase signature domain-containing protein [Fusarium redolens]|uniref:Amidase signature domain-containing protein n=1 Tax=Fusarium redolens TaxID=48865 RepID=A0A9P9GZI5_FUSRE|nr:amidase signature domain-containing protein [Fusarium redolens]KAH7247550.1 amidase signature domain-containing protein [Fusarium redolens]